MSSDWTYWNKGQWPTHGPLIENVKNSGTFDSVFSIWWVKNKSEIWRKKTICLFFSILFPFFSPHKKCKLALTQTDTRNLILFVQHFIRKLNDRKIHAERTCTVLTFVQHNLIKRTTLLYSFRLHFLQRCQHSVVVFETSSAGTCKSCFFFNSHVTCFTHYGQSPINVASYNRLRVNLIWYSMPKVGGLCGYLVYLQKGNWVNRHDAIYRIHWQHNAGACGVWRICTSLCILHKKKHLFSRANPTRIPLWKMH